MFYSRGMEAFEMTRKLQILAAATLLLSSHGQALGVDKQSGLPVPFEVASVHFEQNATDGDVEVVFEVEGGDEGVAKLTVVSPDGRTVIDFTAPDASTLGIRTFRFESPEPGDVKRLKAAYPEGGYIFSGETVGGDKLRGNCTLNHKLPATVSFLRPRANAENVDGEGLIITWTPVKNLAAYIIEVEQEELDVSILAKLPGSVATFTMPGGFLLPGTEYKLGIGAVAEEGNISFVETVFKTAAQE